MLFLIYLKIKRKNNKKNKKIMIKTVTKISAEWCQPCKVYAKTFHKVEEMEEFKNIEFKEIDIENDEEGETIAEKYQIRSVPTTLLFDEENTLIYKISGNISKEDLITTINNAMKDNSND